MLMPNHHMPISNIGDHEETMSSSVRPLHPLMLAAAMYDSIFSLAELSG
jgi:hypothetical protein